MYMYIYCIGTSNKISVKNRRTQPYARGPLFNCPACPCVKTALITQG